MYTSMASICTIVGSSWGDVAVSIEEAPTAGYTSLLFSFLPCCSDSQNNSFVRSAHNSSLMTLSEFQVLLVSPETCSHVVLSTFQQTEMIIEDPSATLKQVQKAKVMGEATSDKQWRSSSLDIFLFTFMSQLQLDWLLEMRRNVEDVVFETWLNIHLIPHFKI